MPIKKMLIVAAALTVSGVAQAQDLLGADIYAERCAVCHGATGAGDGAVGELFERRPKDLRMLARENSGIYPAFEVLESIDGRRDIAAHGTTEMPIWGDVMMEEALIDRGINNKDARTIAQARMVALVYHLQSLQLE